MVFVCLPNLIKIINIIVILKGLKEFLYLSDLLNVRITGVKDRQTVFEKVAPTIYNSKASLFIVNLVKHK